MTLPSDYTQRVYAAVLGKIIGVYIGRPFEGWPHERIVKELGEVWYYVNERLKHPLVVADDDISGTFSFIRALEDHGVSRDLTAEQIGKTWLNYIIEKRAILWWGGMGHSTEHTAFLRLKRGIPAPQSGSIQMNGKVVAEQIGAQIFIDGWAMLCPGDPEQAANFARKAASVSHDGEAIHGAQVIAAMEAQAFIERDLSKLLDTALRFIPGDSVICRMIGEIRSLREKEDDWRAAFAWLKQNYGYDKYGGNCHVVPNHGIIHLALLWGEDDFQKSLMIANTCGWDTDCNAANVGCLLGIKNGLAGIDAGADFRTPVADQLFLPTADGGRGISDAVQQTYAIVNPGRALAGEEPIAPKGGARYHFELPGSVQAFAVQPADIGLPPATIENVEGHSERGSRSLAIRCRQLARGRSAIVLTPTFIPPQMLNAEGYGMLASPTLYSNQVLEAWLSADATNAHSLGARLLIRYYDPADQVQALAGETIVLKPGQRQTLRWTVPDTQGLPIVQVGIEVMDQRGGTSGTVYLDSLSWNGEPMLTLARSSKGPYKAWKRAWVDATDHFWYEGEENLKLIQNEGRGLLMYGTRQWRDYQVRARITPLMVECAGLAVRVQGLRRYYVLLLKTGNKVQLVKVRDEQQTVLAEARLDWQFTRSYELGLSARGRRLEARIDGHLLLQAHDEYQPFDSGGIALICEEGSCSFGPVRITPATGDS